MLYKVSSGGSISVNYAWMWGNTPQDVPATDPILGNKLGSQGYGNIFLGSQLHLNIVSRNLQLPITNALYSDQRARILPRELVDVHRFQKWNLRHLGLVPSLAHY